MAKDNRGWHNESERHSLAAKGIKSGTKTPQQMRSDAKRIVNGESTTSRQDQMLKQMVEDELNNLRQDPSVKDDLELVENDLEENHLEPSSFFARVINDSADIHGYHGYPVDFQHKLAQEAVTDTLKWKVASFAREIRKREKIKSENDLTRNWHKVESNKYPGVWPNLSPDTVSVNVRQVKIKDLSRTLTKDERQQIEKAMRDKSKFHIQREGETYWYEVSGVNTSEGYRASFFKGRKNHGLKMMNGDFYYLLSPTKALYDETD